MGGLLIFGRGWEGRGGELCVGLVTHETCEREHEHASRAFQGNTARGLLAACVGGGRHKHFEGASEQIARAKGDEDG